MMSEPDDTGEVHSMRVVDRDVVAVDDVPLAALPSSVGTTEADMRVPAELVAGDRDVVGGVVRVDAQREGFGRFSPFFTNRLSEMLTSKSPSRRYIPVWLLNEDVVANLVPGLCVAADQAGGPQAIGRAAGEHEPVDDGVGRADMQPVAGGLEDGLLRELSRVGRVALVARDAGFGAAERERRW